MWVKLWARLGRNLACRGGLPEGSLQEPLPRALGGLGTRTKVSDLTFVMNVLCFVSFPRDPPGGQRHKVGRSDSVSATPEATLSLWAQVPTSANKAAQERTFRAAYQI